jgi:hypothetical protein
MTKIILKTSGIRLTGRKRAPDIDHATQILDLVGKGYSVNASDDESLWSISFLKYSDHPVFVNQPEGTERVIRMVVNYGSENASLTDMPIPPWCSALSRFIQTAAPSTTFISSNIAPTGDTNG